MDRRETCGVKSTACLTITCPLAYLPQEAHAAITYPSPTDPIDSDAYQSPLDLYLKLRLQRLHSHIPMKTTGEVRELKRMSPCLESSHMLMRQR